MSDKYGGVGELFLSLNIGHVDSDIEQLEKNIAYLEGKGLAKLNARLMEQKTKPLKFLEALAEHNFTVNLMRNVEGKGVNLKIAYEPKELDVERPPDLCIVYGGVKYVIQIKRLSSSKRESMQGKVFNEINRQLKKINIDMRVDLQLSESFASENIQGLVDFIATKASLAKCGDYYEYNSSDSRPIANFKFQTSSGSNVGFLRLGSYGDMNMIEVTGHSQQQIKDSFENAFGAFRSVCSPKTINIIVAEVVSPLMQVAGLCEALYGTEIIQHDTRLTQSVLIRQSDGMFRSPLFLEKVAAVVVVSRKNHALISDYNQVLCVNSSHLNLMMSIEGLIKIDKRIDENYFPGRGFFDF